MERAQNAAGSTPRRQPAARQQGDRSERQVAGGSRRGLLRGLLAATGAAGALTATGAAPAQAADYPPRPYPKGPALLPENERHLVSRFSYGVTPALAQSIRDQGGTTAWFIDQLRGEAITDPKGAEVDAWWPSLWRSPAELWQRQESGTEGGWLVMADYQRWVMMRRMVSRRRVHEVMTDFWENHLHLPAVADPHFTHRVPFAQIVRKHALGRFEDLLVATATHPAMLLYLDAADSTKEHPNENLGRELLELHTLGVGNFTEADVRDSARILTGWSVEKWTSWAPVYRSEDHYVGAVKVKDFTDPNGAADGRPVTERYLRYLAKHPATARTIATKLVTRFVRDDAPGALIDRLTQRYLDAGTDIKPVLKTLVTSEEFTAAANLKVRDPSEDVIASYLAVDAKLAKPPDPSAPGYGDAAVTGLAYAAGTMGGAPFSWGAPSGQPLVNSAWSSPARLMASMSFHEGLAGGWWPKVNVSYRSPVSWLPQASLRFDELVDHLARQLLHRPSTSRLLEAACTATSIRPEAMIDAGHELVVWKMPRLLMVLLDSPTHLSR